MRTGEYPDDWEDRRQRVFQRDEYECQQCGSTDPNLQVHHITPISEGGSHELSNLETVCRSCHASEHPTKVKISQALSENRRIRMKYRSSSGTRVRELDPYGMAMHEGIQYLVGYDYYREEIRIFRPTRITWLEVLDEGFSTPDGWNTSRYLENEMGYQRTTNSTGCFIATAAYDTPMAAEIDILRDLRDDVLRKHRLTRWTVPTYYSLSPPIAEWISRSHARRKIVRRYVVSPIVKLAEKALS